jgi:hypothetical protein
LEEVEEVEKWKKWKKWKFSSERASAGSRQESCSAAARSGLAPERSRGGRVEGRCS